MSPALRTVVRVAVCLLFSFTSLVIYSQEKRLVITRQSTVAKGNPVAAALPGARVIRFGPENRKQFFAEQENSPSFDWYIDDDIRWSLNLTKTTITSTDFAIAGLPGTKSDMPVLPQLYKGTALKDKGEVRLAINDDFVYGFIDDGKTRYFIEPLKKFDSTAGTDQYLLYDIKSVKRIENFCGTPDPLPSAIDKIVTESGTPAARQTCFQLRIAIATDYSIYEKYKSIQSIVNYSLANWNVIPAYYRGFNLDNENATDVGDDDINFVVTSLYISTSKFNDVVPEGGLTLRSFTLWGRDHFPAPYDISELITTRKLPTPSAAIGIATFSSTLCNNVNPPAHIVNDYFDNLSFAPGYVSALIAAHETGHNLGCGHDNDIHPSVRYFVMNAGLIEGVTRFSINSDFPADLPFSSKYYIKTTFSNSTACTPGKNCTVNTCERVDKLELTPVTSTSVRLTWKAATGDFIVQYKPKADSVFIAANTITVNSNEVTITGLNPCTEYQFLVQRKCDAVTVSTPVILSHLMSGFRIDSLSLQNFGNHRYDLQFILRYLNGTANALTVEATAGNTKKTVSFSGSSQRISIPGIFQDGQLLNYLKIRVPGYTDCGINVPYKIPPYIDTTCQALLAADFNDCGLPDGWTNVATRRIIAQALTIGKNDISKSSTGSNFPFGSIDSSCMIFYDFNNNGFLSQVGVFELKSPVTDISNKANVTLSFDYVYYANPGRNPAATPFIKAEVFDGSNWVRVFMRDSSTQYINYSSGDEFWYSVPPRVTINVDRYRNPLFQVRFIVDDGVSSGILQGIWTAAFDNIRLCGQDICNDPVNQPIPKQTGTIHNRQGIRECTDASYFTHYSTTGDSLLLSIKKPMTTALELYPGNVSVNYFFTGKVVNASTAPYVKPGNRWVLFNKYWQITPQTTVSDSCTIRVYFTQAELEEVAKVIGAPVSTDLVRPYYLRDAGNAFSIPFHGSVTASDIVFPFTQITKKDNYYVVEFAAKLPLTIGLGASLENVDALIQLNGIVKEDRISLQWIMPDETTVDKYIVERSVNGVNFTAIGSVNNAGISNYSFDDAQPLAGANYYRIRIADAQGRYAFSKIILLRFSKGRVNTIFAYPNPLVNDDLQLEINTQQAGTVTIELLNATGQLIQRQVQSLSPGFNRKTIYMKYMATGVYTLRCQVAGAVEYIRIIKL